MRSPGVSGDGQTVDSVLFPKVVSSERGSRSEKEQEDSDDQVRPYILRNGIEAKESLIESISVDEGQCTWKQKWDERRETLNFQR